MQTIPLHNLIWYFIELACQFVNGHNATQTDGLLKVQEQVSSLTILC